MKISGPIRCVRIKAGGYRLLETWWVEHEQLAGCAARVGDASTGGATAIEQTEAGRLTISAGLEWDGPSVPYLLRWAITDALIAASLPHDAGYELERSGHVPADWRIRYDRVMHDVGTGRGLNSAWASTVYHALRWFGASAASRRPEVEDTELML